MVPSFWAKVRGVATPGRPFRIYEARSGSLSSAILQNLAPSILLLWIAWAASDTTLGLILFAHKLVVMKIVSTLSFRLIKSIYNCLYHVNARLETKSSTSVLPLGKLNVYMMLSTAVHLQFQGLYDANFVGFFLVPTTSSASQCDHRSCCPT